MTPPPPDPHLVAQHGLIYELERAAMGHGLDNDRRLHVEAARALRDVLGLAPGDPLQYPSTPSAYPPTRNDPPIGHSLPDSRASDR